MTRGARCALVFGLLPLVHAAVPQPADWAPARWPWTTSQSLELLSGGAINCLLLENYSPELVSAASERNIATLAVITPGADVAATARRAIDAKLTGMVLEGDFADDAVSVVKEIAGSAPVIELTSRAKMRLASDAAVLGTYQGVWPGISEQENGAHRAGPTGSTWIDTNTGFIRAARAWGSAALWVANRPPAGTVIPVSRYLQAIGDAGASGARWVIALDSDFAARLGKGDEAAAGAWRRMLALDAWFERHAEWRRMQEFGNLAVVQDPAKGGLVSGGILDMIAVKHTPVRPIPRERLTPDALQGATMAVNVDAESLTPEQKEVLRNFARRGGTLLTGPPGWKDATPAGGRITLEKAELERLNDIWRDVNNMVGRRNLGVRLFNVSSMLSNVLVSEDGKTEVVHLVNYADYPVENVTMQFLGDYKHATLVTPEGAEKRLEIYATEEGSGVDIEKVGVCATVRLEQ